MTPEIIEETLLKLADIASDVTMPMFRAPLDIANKEEGGFDPVTLADKQAEAAIRKYINSNFPSHGIIGEEDGSTNKDAEYVWVIDPIDGTRAFISGLPGWGTLIGLTKNKKPIAGIMCQPFTKERYFTNGLTSTLLHEGKKTILKTSNVTALSDATAMTTDPFIFAKEETPSFDLVRGQVKLMRYGFDCYAYAMVAAGNIDLVIESGLHIYDVSALIPIVENAGGLFTNWQGEPVANGGQVIAAANQELLNQAIELLNN
ncbi:MAG: histidinol-phosphatase [Nitratireductor sp.]